MIDYPTGVKPPDARYRTRDAPTLRGRLDVKHHEP